MFTRPHYKTLSACPDDLTGLVRAKRRTVCVTGAGVGVDVAWEQKKLEARKMLVNRAESPASSARFVGWRVVQDSLLEKMMQDYRLILHAQNEPMDNPIIAPPKIERAM